MPAQRHVSGCQTPRSTTAHRIDGANAPERQALRYVLRLGGTSHHFRGLSKLAELAAEIGPRRRPDFNETLDGLLNYVRRKCGKPMYSQLEHVFHALGIPAQNLAQRKYDRSNKPKRPKSVR